ncbi:peptidase S8/S53 domain-containing protein [Cercophora newfieldiana]|uniref:Peptidase S8/S53 domain-containing protein n=1 Tax=Cercophora newfieldiana TaxID=92897 RepID=A0AA39YTR0_9PEZI|nr:peptidase S8/S53 domain-containing protein [Cercophora newfieldiana]
MNAEDKKGGDLYPCEHFELICGSEWGGVLAVMLGRMQMSVQECEEWFMARIDKLQLDPTSWLKPRDWIGGVGPVLTSRTEVLMDEFQQLLGDRGREDFIEQESEDFNDYCRTLVLAADLKNVAEPMRFTSYPSPRTQGFSVLDVMMAALPLPAWMWPAVIPLTLPSSAAQPMKKQTTTCFAASATGHANPSFQALIEAENEIDGPFGHLWTPSQIHSLVSIGTGIRDKHRQLDDDLGTSRWAYRLDQDAAAMYGRSITDTERTHVQLERFLQSSGGINYYRFNAPDQVVSARIGDWRWTKTDEFKKRLSGYMESPKTRAELRGCYRSLGLFLGPQNIDTNSHDELRGYAPEPVFAETLPSIETSEGADEWVTKYKSKLKWLINGKDRERNPDDRIRIALLDTGVQATHPDISRMWGIPTDEKRNSWLQEHFADFCIPGSNCIEGDPKDTAGHGTQVAGILLQLAPNADLYVGRISETETVRSDRVKRGIEHAVKAWKVQVICLALGFIDHNQPVERELILAAAQGCVVIASASNSGRRSTTYYPARSRYAICARSADYTGKNSEFNPPPERCLNFAFLGEGIRTTCIRQEPSDNDEAPDKDLTPPPGMECSWKRFGGTSASAAVASAIAAQIMDCGRIYSRELENYGLGRSLLESQVGIEHVFKAMYRRREVIELPSTEQAFIDIPWKVLNNREKIEQFRTALNPATLGC